MEQKIDRYFSLIGAQQEQAAQDLYWREIWPWVVQRFVERAGALRGRFQRLISLVGLSPEPVILTIRALQPREVCFVLSAQSRTLLDTIIEHTRLSPSRYLAETVDPSDQTEVYQVIKHFVADQDLNRVAIDLTGGKKSMVGGAAQAAGLLGCCALYVDYQQYHQQWRKPVPGSEFLNVLQNPYQVFGELDLDRARKLYQAGNYLAAVEVLEALLNRARDIRQARILKEIAAMQGYWQNYQFHQAGQALDRAQNWVETYGMYRHLLDVFKEKRTVLQNILQGQSSWIVLNHYTMAQQYAAQQKFDFAVLLLYRTLELVMADRLKQQYQLDVSEPDYQPFPDLLKKMQQLSRQVFGSRSRPLSALPFKVGLMAGLMILKVFNDELVRPVNLNEIRKQADNRNNGILAHGRRPNSKKQFNEMDGVFFPILQRYLAMVFPDRSVPQLLRLFEPVNI